MALTMGEWVGIALGGAGLAVGVASALVMVCLAARGRWRRHRAGDIEMGPISTKVGPIGDLRRSWRVGSGPAQPRQRHVSAAPAAPANAGANGGGEGGAGEREGGQ